MSRPPAWLKRLARTGALMAPTRYGAGWAIYPRGDRRRRPTGRLSDAQRRQAAARGWISPGPDGDESEWTISEAGRAALVRAQAGGDFAAPHRDIVPRPVLETVPGNNPRIERRAANAAQSPLWRWRRTGAITAAGFEAGERLRTDYHLSGLAGRVTLDWTAPRVSGRSGRGPEDAPAAAIDARRRVFAALEAAGEGLADMLVAACLREEGAAALERRFGWGRGGAGPVLSIALDRLAAHYGLGRV